MRWVLLAFLCACGEPSGTPQPDAPVVEIDAPPPILEDMHLYGRFDAQGAFAWEGSQIVTRFEGTSIAVDLSDTASRNWFEVTVDGVAQPALQATQARTTQTLASGLSAGMHDLVLARRTEGTYGTSHFYGFPGATLVATPRKTRMIEMIGDSITAGYGVLGVGPTCNFSLPTEAESHAWGTFAADALDAAHVSIAISGFGMYRDNAGSTNGTLPARYDRLAPNGATQWTWDYTPDVIVINLGTNDFQQGDPGQPFVTAYVAFVQTLRTRFANAKILLTTSPMLADTFPAGQMHYTKHRAYLDQIVTMLADPGVSIVDIATQAPADGYGCDYHPNEVTQHKMADVLVPAIRAATGW